MEIALLLFEVETLIHEWSGQVFVVPHWSASGGPAGSLPCVWYKFVSIVCYKKSM